jgi:hypothetical protein
MTSCLVFFLWHETQRSLLQTHMTVLVVGARLEDSSLLGTSRLPVVLDTSHVLQLSAPVVVMQTGASWEMGRSWVHKHSGLNLHC